MTRDGKLVIDNLEIGQRLVEAMGSYTAVYRKGCTPPDSLTWYRVGNNQAFLAQNVVMTTNESLSIPNTLKGERPDDYDDNTATIEWPLGPDGEAFPIETAIFQSVVFKSGDHVATAKAETGDRGGARRCGQRRCAMVSPALASSTAFLVKRFGLSLEDRLDGEPSTLADAPGSAP